MSTLLKQYEPLRELDSMMRRVSDILHSPFSFSMPSLWGSNNSFVPKVDISEDEKNVYVHVELPGMEKEHVKVTVSEDRVLTIKGERKKEEKHEAKNYIRLETNYGSFMRSFVLPENVQEDAISGEFDKGFLKLMLPKKETTQPPKEKEIALN
ncbi:MAG: Hsp20/alpha crystallin family protein [Bacteroidota bacterium]|nr:Hsp20/alpha crystallin family protein [Candidatus Kapabacteria bacterium]MDW8219399.1 Hsp20/alpha crystallin family protein [Bacteroidota bacterium]